MAYRRSIMSRLKLLIDGAVTRVYRKVLRTRTDEELLRHRIRLRARELGRRYSDGNSDILGYTYHPIPFPEFGGIRSHRHSCEERLDLILQELPLDSGDWILDVGANVGFFAFGLERAGATVEAYELDSSTFEIGAALAKLYDARVLYINKAVSHAALPFLRPRYRAVLLLSVFHWIVKQDGEEKASAVLKELARRADYIFFEAPCALGDAMFQHRWFESTAACEEYLRSALPNALISALGTDPAWMGRTLYKIDCSTIEP